MKKTTSSFLLRQLKDIQQMPSLLVATLLMGFVLLAYFLTYALLREWGQMGFGEAMLIFGVMAFITPLFAGIAMAPYWLLMKLGQAANGAGMRFVAFIFRGLSVASILAELAFSVFQVVDGNEGFILGVILLAGYICAGLTWAIPRALTWGISRLESKEGKQRA